MENKEDLLAKAEPLLKESKDKIVNGAKGFAKFVSSRVHGSAEGQSGSEFKAPKIPDSVSQMFGRVANSTEAFVNAFKSYSPDGSAAQAESATDSAPSATSGDNSKPSSEEG